MSHLIFFDGKCPLCHRLVRFVLKADQKKQFIFAPLDGTTAASLLQPIPESLVLIQNYKQPNQKTFYAGKASLRILWLLGGKYRPIGCLSFLPSLLFDIFYRVLAKSRSHLFTATPFLTPNEIQNRFLP